MLTLPSEESLIQKYETVEQELEKLHGVVDRFREFYKKWQIEDETIGTICLFFEDFRSKCYSVGIYELSDDAMERHRMYAEQLIFKYRLKFSDLAHPLSELECRDFEETFHAQVERRRAMIPKNKDGIKVFPEELVVEYYFSNIYYMLKRFDQFHVDDLSSEEEVLPATSASTTKSTTGESAAKTTTSTRRIA